jgi:hypothetical protein
MTESLIKINGFPPIILANFAFASGDTSRRKPLIWKDGMILAESCPGVRLVPLTGTSSPDSGQLPHQSRHATGPRSPERRAI